MRIAVSAGDTVTHNLSVWLLRSVQTEQPFSAATSLEAVQSTVDSAGLTDEERAAVMAKLDKVANLPINVMANGPMFLLGYIPNLVEFAPG